MKNLDYGVIGNCRSAALVSSRGNIEWLCLPYFNSSSFFGKILDQKLGGEFGFEVAESYTIKQKYIPQTNILSTMFQDGDKQFELIDFMPRYRNEGGSYYTSPEVIRIIRLISGQPTFRVKYDPRPCYGLYKTKSRVQDDYLKTHTVNGTYESIYLYSNLNYKHILSNREIVLQRDCWFVISYNQKIKPIDTALVYLEYQRTKVYWLNWVQHTLKLPLYTDEVIRSALVLKTLAFQKTGAILAAVTTSLPETLGEVRNWDYRFCWMRDSAMMIRAFITLGHYVEAKRFLNFIMDVIPYKDSKMQIMYGILGEKKLKEEILIHLEGYEGSRPVRIGNAAYKQKQNDIYGVIMDVIYQNFKIYSNNNENSEEFWTIARSIMKIVKRNWMKPDKGIWELRSVDKHFVFSKVLCWVAFDRGVKIATYLGKTRQAHDWARSRDRVREDIYKNGWNEGIQAFTQAYGTTDMDAANLLMENYGFIDAKDPKYISTVRVIYKELSRNGLMYRYKNSDDFGIPSSSFTICSFWMVRSLCITGEKVLAKKMFEQLLSYGNHLGLFSEDLDFETKRLLGNFPQGYSHLALIEAAVALNEYHGKEEFKYFAQV